MRRERTLKVHHQQEQNKKESGAEDQDQLPHTIGLKKIIITN